MRGTSLGLIFAPESLWSLASLPFRAHREAPRLFFGLDGVGVVSLEDDFEFFEDLGSSEFLESPACLASFESFESFASASGFPSRAAKALAAGVMGPSTSLSDSDDSFSENTDTVEEEEGRADEDVGRVAFAGGEEASCFETVSVLTSPFLAHREAANPAMVELARV